MESDLSSGDLESLDSGGLSSTEEEDIDDNLFGSAGDSSSDGTNDIDFDMNPDRSIDRGGHAHGARRLAHGRRGIGYGGDGRERGNAPDESLHQGCSAVRGVQGAQGTVGAWCVRWSKRTWSWMYGLCSSFQKCFY